MQQVQNLQNKRLQQTLNSVAELNVQIIELKKRLEDVDAKNREISANIRHISGGEPTKTAENIGNSSTNKEGPNISSVESTSSSTSNTINTLAQICENNPKKRRIDMEASETFDEIIPAEDKCDLPIKKSKI